MDISSFSKKENGFVSCTRHYTIFVKKPLVYGHVAEVSNKKDRWSTLTKISYMYVSRMRERERERERGEERMKT
jgi:hypothetical protein